MLAKITLTLLALAISASALQITSPSNSSGWTAQGSQVIEWDSVSTDPSNFTIQLITPSSPNNPQTLAQEVDTSSGSYTYTPPNALSEGEQYRVNFVSTTASNAGILAQSDYFEVQAGEGSSVSASASKSAAASTSSASASASSSPASAGPSRSASAGTGSASSPAASAAQSSGGASTLIAPTGLLALVAAALGVFA